MSEQLEKVSFDFIRYANCWEDADVLLKGLRVNNQSRVMSIASAGDNSFSLLSASPELVVAVDISKVQLYLVELKKAAISNFDREAYLEFAGFSASATRLEKYNAIRNQLGEACRAYWDQQRAAIENGIIHNGKFENYFQLFKKEYLHKIHNDAVVAELFRPKTEEAQREFHDRIWHTDEWKTMYKFFFGEQMMGTHGRDSEFLKHVKGTVSDLILAQEMAHLRKKQAQRNYFLHYILYNRFDEDFLPHYAREENYEAVKKNLDRLVLHEGLLDIALQKHKGCTHFNLSDIFEYMDMTLFRNVASGIISKSAPGARIAYWNLMIPRRISDIFPTTVVYQEQLSKELTETDMGYFYRTFIVDEKL